MGGRLKYRRLRVPQGDGDALIAPPLETAAERIARGPAPPTFAAGSPWSTISQQARRDLLADASQHVSAYTDSPLGANANRRPVILTGHQPELFHAGVWLKNFVASSLAAHAGGTAVHLLIDNDTPRTASLTVPSGSPSSPVRAPIPYDRALGNVPYEEREVEDLSLFAGFGERVAAGIAPFVREPLVGRIWPAALRAARRRGRLGECLAESRHLLELAWGLETLEVPLSRVCRRRGFQQFAAGLLADFERLANDHNAALREYRLLHGIRSRAHPVGDLKLDGEWREMPLWIWRSSAPQRRPLFVRRVAGELEITDRGSLRRTIPVGERGGLDAPADRLAELESSGVKLRPRALLTTMFARLFLGDLFIHGIGGAKYDQLTDEIIRRFFGFEPPPFLTVTGTFLLPIDAPSDPAEERRRTAALLRDLNFNPDRRLSREQLDRPQIAALVEEKQRLIRANPPPGERRERHEAIEHVNAALQKAIESKRAAVERRLAELDEQERRRRLLAGREYSFCLFPESSLREKLLELSRLVP